MPTTLEFPQTVAAVRLAEDASRSADAGLWMIGDALIAECGPPGARGVNDDSHTKLQRVAAELFRELGYQPYSLAMLRKLRENAARFPDANRLSSVTWTVHLEAGDPEVLAAAVEAAEAQEHDLTVSFAKSVKETLRARQRPDPEGDYQGDDIPEKWKALTASSKAQGLARDFQHILQAVSDQLSPTDKEELAAKARAVAVDWHEGADRLAPRAANVHQLH